MPSTYWAIPCLLMEAAYCQREGSIGLSYCGSQTMSPGAAQSSQKTTASWRAMASCPVVQGRHQLKTFGSHGTKTIGLGELGLHLSEQGLQTLTIPCKCHSILQLISWQGCSGQSHLCPDVPAGYAAGGQA